MERQGGDICESRGVGISKILNNARRKGLLMAEHGGPNARDSHGKPGLHMAALMYPTPTTGAGLCGGSGNYQQLKALEAAGEITEWCPGSSIRYSGQ